MGGRGSASSGGGSGGNGGSGGSGGGSGSSGGGGSSSAARAPIEHLPGGAMRTTFAGVSGSHAGSQWSAYASKEYGASKTVYITATSPKGFSRSGTEYKSAYSKTKGEFTNFQAGHLDTAKAAARALGII